MFVLITGHPRSGTTLLQQLCDRHPALGVTNEFGALRYVERPYGDHARAMLSRWQDVAGNWAYHKAYAGSPRRKWHNLLFTLRYLAALGRDGFGPVTLPRVQRAYGRLFGATAVVGDKLPLYLYFIDQFLDAPDVKRVVVYRDCRDVTSSFLKKARTDWRDMEWVKQRDTAAKVAQRWVEGIERMERHADGLHVIRYELLVQQPRVEVARLAEYLGVDAAGFSPEMVQADKVGKHRDGLTAAELADVMAVAGETMVRLGYGDA